MTPITHTGYCDYNGSAPLSRAAERAMVDYLRGGIGNPSAVHAHGRKARGALEQARTQIASDLGIDPETIVFTSGGTESNNLFLETVRQTAYPLYMTTVEHASLLDGVGAYTPIPLMPTGVVDLAALSLMLSAHGAAGGGPFFLSLHGAHNVTGVVQPIAAVAAIVHGHGGFLHVDGAQALGRIDVAPWLAPGGADYVTLSSHKVGGPSGVGALIVGKGCPIHPLLRGGGQEKYRRSGTPNLLGIIGFAAALSEGIEAFKTGIWDRVAALRQDLEQRIRDGAPGSVIMGWDAPRLPNTLYVTMPGVSSAAQVMDFDLAGFAVSAGSACSSGALKPPDLLTHFGYGAPVAGSALRISFCPDVNEETVRRLGDVWIRLYDRSGDKTPCHGSPQGDICPRRDPIKPITDLQ